MAYTSILSLFVCLPLWLRTFTKRMDERGLNLFNRITVLADGQVDPIRYGFWTQAKY